MTLCYGFVCFRFQVQQHGGQLGSRDVSGLPHAPALPPSTAAGRLFLHKPISVYHTVVLIYLLIYVNTDLTSELRKGGGSGCSLYPSNKKCLKKAALVGHIILFDNLYYNFMSKMSLQTNKQTATKKTSSSGLKTLKTWRLLPCGSVYLYTADIVFQSCTKLQ